VWISTSEISVLTRAFLASECMHAGAAAWVLCKSENHNGLTTHFASQIHFQETLKQLKLLYKSYVALDKQYSKAVKSRSASVDRHRRLV
jgi:UTP-glucose-1-phosphate uridylyltransferase